ncbi:MAG: DUF354 domain-containing protein [Candidatus Aenigmatarchaeota archaeon]|nr:MAG: DUF354 domain-containing protein [Candidatus Aenigmarchaeota archaeon]
MKFWIDVTSLPHVNFFRALIKKLEKSGNEVIVTCREFGIMNDILERNGIEYRSVGSHGGKGLKEKLIHSSERIIELAKLMSLERPDIGISKHSIESARVCFGLGIPSVMVIDHETASKQSRLTAPLVNVVVAPEFTDKEMLARYGAKDLKTFYGICESAHFNDFKPSKDVLDDIGLSSGDKIVIGRTEPLLASHNFKESLIFSVLARLKEDDEEMNIVFIPRNEKDRITAKKLGFFVPERSIDVLSLYSFADLMIGAGSCMNREASIGGCPTISICPDRLPGVDRFLIERGLMFHSCTENDIISKAEEILKSKKRNDTDSMKRFEDPHEIIMEAVKSVS